MIFLAILGLVVLASFAFVLFYGAPYLPTLGKQTAAAMKLAGPGEGRVMLELGCGDGKVLVAAARSGWQVVGYELNPILALISWLRTRRYHKQVRVVCGNFWSQQWPPCDVVFTFLLPKYMVKLSKKITQECGSSVKLVSFAFTVPGVSHEAELDGVYRYSAENLRQV